MRMHGRDMVSVDTADVGEHHCSVCTDRVAGRRIKAVVCDREDSSFRLCEDCWLRWDVRESGLPAKLAEAGIRAYRSVEIHTGCIHISQEASKTLDAITDRLKEAELSA